MRNPLFLYLYGTHEIIQTENYFSRIRTILDPAKRILISQIQTFMIWAEMALVKATLISSVILASNHK